MMVYCKSCFQVYWVDDETNVEKLRMKCGRCSRADWELAI